MSYLTNTDKAVIKKIVKEYRGTLSGHNKVMFSLSKVAFRDNKVFFLCKNELQKAFIEYLIPQINIKIKECIVKQVEISVLEIGDEYDSYFDFSLNEM